MNRRYPRIANITSARGILAIGDPRFRQGRPNRRIHLVCGRARHSRTGDDRHVPARPFYTGAGHCGTQDPFGSVSRYRVAQLAPSNKRDAALWAASFWCPSCEDDYESACRSLSAGKQRVDLPRGLDGPQHRNRLRGVRDRLRAQNLAALAAAVGQHCPAGTRGHPLAESVRLAALPRIWLERALHCVLRSCAPAKRAQSPMSIPMWSWGCQRVYQAFRCPRTRLRSCMPTGYLPRIAPGG